MMLDGRPGDGPRYPSLYQINTRVWLTERSRALGRPATLDDIPDAELDGVAGMGFDWIWLLSVWQTGPAGQRVSRANHSGAESSSRRCPTARGHRRSGLRSPHPCLPPRRHGALARLRERLRPRSAAVPIRPTPGYISLGRGAPRVLRRGPTDLRGRHKLPRLSDAGDLVLAHGRDPYFAAAGYAAADYGHPASIRR